MMKAELVDVLRTRWTETRPSYHMHVPSNFAAPHHPHTVIGASTYTISTYFPEFGLFFTSNSKATRDTPLHSYKVIADEFYPALRGLHELVLTVRESNFGWI
jgi:hypothetical protein